jgi:hypothetical protein
VAGGAHRIPARGGKTHAAHRWTKLFLKRCPLCQEVVQDGAAGVVHCLGLLYCCQAHADRDEASLFRALQVFYRRHAARHGANRLLPAAVFPYAMTQMAERDAESRVQLLL